jgi:hypothetical protein
MIRYVASQDHDIRIIPHYEFVTEQTEFSGIVISGVDTPESRRTIWRAIQSSDVFVSLYMDGRLGGDEIYLLSIDPTNPDQIERYDKTLVLKGAVDQSCATRENPHSAFGIAQMVSMNLTLFFEGKPFRDAVRRNLRVDATRQ